MQYSVIFGTSRPICFVSYSFPHQKAVLGLYAKKAHTKINARINIMLSAFLLTIAFDGLPNQFSLMWKITSSILSTGGPVFNVNNKHFQLFVY